MWPLHSGTSVENSESKCECELRNIQGDEKQNSIEYIAF